MADQPDQVLLAWMQRGDRRAIEYLIQRYQRPLYNFAYRFLNDGEAAADVCQYAFIQLFTHCADMHADEGLRAWLFRVVHHRCLDELRRKRETTFSQLAQEARENDGGATLEQIADSAPLPETLVEQEDLQQILAAAIAALPPKYREVVTLRYAADLSFAEIGTILHIPEATAKTQFHRAKPLLREFLAKYGITRAF